MVFSCERYVAAASIIPTGSGLLCKAEQCRSIDDVNTPDEMDI